MTLKTPVTSYIEVGYYLFLENKSILIVTGPFIHGTETMGMSNNCTVLLYLEILWRRICLFDDW